MNNPIQLQISRAPALIPGMVEAVQKASNPLILVPESFTLSAEQALVKSFRGKGIIGTQVLSPSSLVREIRERAGFPDRKLITSDGRHMILSLLLVRNQSRLSFYQENVHQSGLAEKIASQIDDLADGGFDPSRLREFSREMKDSTKYKCSDIALIWEEYQKILEQGFLDRGASWQLALDRLEKSGLMQGADLIICGFDVINRDLTALIAAAYPLVRSITIGMVGETGCPDDHIFALASGSVKRFVRRITGPGCRLPVKLSVFPGGSRQGTPGFGDTVPASNDTGILAQENVASAPYETGILAQENVDPGSHASGIPTSENAASAPYETDIPAQQKADPGIRFLERTVYALGQPSGEAEVPDLSAVQVYYAANTANECLYTAQTLIEWHHQGIAWHDMAVAICDETTLSSMLPLVLASSGIPFSTRTGTSMLLSEYAQYFLATLRSMRTAFAQEEMLRLIKSRFTGMSEEDMMDLENYVRANGIDLNKWRRPFPGDDLATQRLEALRQSLMQPLEALRAALTKRSCTGKAAAQAIYEHMIHAGAYDILLRREKELLDAGALSTADHNRQVWTAVCELLDQLALFAPEDHLSLPQLCAMLESSLSAGMIKSLPQVADSVLLSSPNMFFTDGIRAIALIGMQDQSAPAPAALLTQAECARLSRAASGGEEPSGIGMTRREAAARAKQDIYQALASATEHLMVSCSAAAANGKVLSSSQAYKDISRLVYERNPENVHGGLTNDELLPFSPQFALERLAVMLRDAREQSDSFLNPARESAESASDAAWRSALIALYHDPVWHGKMRSVLEALHVTLESPGIPADLASKLYQQNPLSVSAVQTAGACLYNGFLSYALRLRIRKDFAFEIDQRGTFAHLVLRRFFEQAVTLPGWPILEDRDVTRLLNRIMIDETREWKDGPLGKNRSGQYRGGEILRYVRTVTHTLVKALREQPHFSPIGMEVGFGESPLDSPMHFPPVTLQMHDGQRISLSGVIDRIDTVTLDDGRQAVLVYDYKSSDKEVHRESLEEGLQIQLPVYLMAVEQGMPGYTLAGALYQPVKPVLVNDVEDNDTEKIESSIEKELQAKGIYLDDKQIQRASAPLKIPARASTTDLINVLSPEGLAQVIEKGAESAVMVIERMLAGGTTPNPVQDGQRSPCEYCDKKDACPLDSRLPGGRVRKLEHVRKTYGSDSESDPED